MSNSKAPTEGDRIFVTFEVRILVAMEIADVTWQITFKEGAVATAGYANIACNNNLSKFHEVLGR
jgi:hypothetical protein